MNFRILDANFNRAAEGLRVVEEYLRFVRNHSHLAEQYKRLRHQLADVRAPLASQLLANRDTAHDVGTDVDTPQELSRTDDHHVAAASQSRVEQALRCLEEYGKTIDTPLHSIAAMRYRIYELGQIWQRTFEFDERLRDARLYVLLDGRGSHEQFEHTARAILAGGADVIQLRDKQLNDRELLRYAKSLRQWCDESDGSQCLFIINDRPDLAVLCDAHGVHVGQDELPAPLARRILGPHQCVGVSTHTVEDVELAIEHGADYIGCGPVFTSQTKSFARFAGLELLTAVASTASTALPAFAIGGITAENLDDVLATGFQRIAVSHAVVAADDPERATATLRSKLDSN